MPWQRAQGYVTRTIRERVPRSRATLDRYGISLRKATTDQIQNRRDDGMTGMGRYKRRLRRYRQGRRRYTGNGLYSGSGGYWGDLAKSAWAGSAGLRGQAGDWLRGGGAGAWGQAAGHVMGATGVGDYAVSNDIVDGGGGVGVPTFSPDNGSAVVISHREFISDVFGPSSAGSFQNTPYSINPGIERTFPWLSQVAANYEEYTLKQCIFTFRSSVTDFVATNGQVGTIIMATQYNPADDAFASKQDAMEYDAAMSGKVSGNMLHGVECDPAQNSGSAGKYMRSGPVPSNTDLKQYDWGKLNVCISNIPAAFINQALGELWVSYTVELRKPKFFVSRGLNILRDTFVAETDSTTGEGLGQLVRTGIVGNAQQNRIGGRLTSLPGTPGFIYTFPATFSGSIKFNLKVRLTDAQLLAESPVVAWSITNVSTNGVSLKAIKDIYSPGDLTVPGTWTHFIYGKASRPADGDFPFAQTEVHLDVISPTSAGVAADNQITFESVNGLGAATLCEGFQLDVEVYNVAFNNARNNQVVIVNAQTDQVVQWPPQ